jgi:gliding motility-associated-like protein
MRKRIFTFCAFLSLAIMAVAQPSNDECATPIELTDITAFCSPSGQFTNAGATPTNYNPAGCVTQNDVWYSFVATATDVNITIRGATQFSPGGTLQDPMVSLHFGTCNDPSLETLECQSDFSGNNVVELYQGGLFVGSTYFIRVQGGDAQTGTFQLCINNYNPPVDPQSDCPKAAILCDKSPFSVEEVTGGGANNGELNDADCFSNGSSQINETNSTWFAWTCSVSGSLTFALTPNNGPDDLDFVLYEIPNGITNGGLNCAGKQVVRCMASGESVNVNSAPCLGATGLRIGETDTSEDAGCSDPGDNAWLSPLQMEAGKTYALCVNNFSLAGNGFGVEFGGTGEFQGPTIKFRTEPSAICLGELVQIIDESSFAPLGNITKWQWSFGATASPLVAVGQGPHTVKFEKAGDQPVVLTVETNLGCKVTDIQYVKVFPDVTVDTLFAAPDCNGGTNGAITINNIKSGTPAYSFSWENGPFTSNNTLTGLTVGTYNLVIKDANNCKTELDITVKELELTVAPDVQKPFCTGDANGVITLNVTNGQGPYQFDWGNGFIPDNVQGGFAAGVYTILGVDSELCKGAFNVTVTDNPPVTLAVDAVNITCFRLNDGVGIATPGGGVGNFTYEWSDSQNQTEAEATGLAPGTYTVTASDANGCSEVGSISITEPPELDVQLVRTLDLLCAGLPTGEIELSASGGREPYEYSATGNNFRPSAVLTGLFAGTYWAKVRDASGCIDSVQATLNQPLPLTLIVSPTDITIDLGYTVQTSTVTGPAGRPVSFMWTPSDFLSCSDCAEPLITATNSQTYVAKITDQDGCMDTATVRITVNKVRPIYYPNVFTPDANDSDNTRFTGYSGPAGAGMTIFRIFDRWGSLVFEGKNIPLNDPSVGWDGTIKGKDAPTGVYTWLSIVQFVDGVSQEYSGDITVVR